MLWCKERVYVVVSFILLSSSGSIALSSMCLTDHSAIPIRLLWMEPKHFDNILICHLYPFYSIYGALHFNFILWEFSSPSFHMCPIYYRLLHWLLIRWLCNMDVHLDLTVNCNCVLEWFIYQTTLLDLRIVCYYLFLRKKPS
jgi:hypothetical protein